MKKMNLKKQCILFMAAALMFTGMPLSAAASEANADSAETIVTETVAETSVSEQAEPAEVTEGEKKEAYQIVYNPGEQIKVPKSLFEGYSGSIKKVYVKGIGEIPGRFYYENLLIDIPFDRDVKKGVYPIDVTFQHDEVASGVIEFVVEEDMKGVHIQNTVVNFDGTKDAVFRFTNGTGKNRIVELQNIDFTAKYWHEGDDDSEVQGFYIDPRKENHKKYISYDLEKGEVRIKKEYFKTQLGQITCGSRLMLWVYPVHHMDLKLANGQIAQVFHYPTDEAILSKDFKNPGDARWYFVNYYEDDGKPVEPEEPEKTDPVEDFVKRLYTNILQREADASGLKAWTDVLKSGKEQGAKVAQGFIESPEFQKRKLTDTQYLEILYQTFFDRKADKAGLDAWLDVLDSGLSRMHVFKGFAESNEFTEICEEYGIIRGNVTLTAPMDQNEGVTKFIVRCYRLCLGRDADKDGLNSWCTQILTGKNTAKEAAHGFVFSDEFKKKNLSDKEYVKTMYRVFMDREADPAGLNSWVKVLKSGKSREHVFNGFADSNEFRKICASYGIK